MVVDDSSTNPTRKLQKHHITEGSLSEYQMRIEICSSVSGKVQDAVSLLLPFLFWRQMVNKIERIQSTCTTWRKNLSQKEDFPNLKCQLAPDDTSHSTFLLDKLSSS